MIECLQVHFRNVDMIIGFTREQGVCIIKQSLSSYDPIKLYDCLSSSLSKCFHKLVIITITHGDPLFSVW